MSKRTTVTLDEDVAAKLDQETRRTRQPFRQVLNEAIRRGLTQAPARSPRKPFRVRARDLGMPAGGLDLENIEELLDRVEGPFRR